MNQTDYERQVDARARQVLDAVVARQENGDVGSIWTVHARLAMGRADEDEVCQSVQRKLETLGMPLEGGAGPFHVLPAMLLLCRWGESPAGRYDLDGSRTVDEGDLFFFNSLWTD